MKKILTLLWLLLITINTIAANWGTTTSLNPYAYGLTSSWDAITQQLTISFTLNAPAVIDETYNDDLGIQIYAVDKETEQKYYMYAVPANDCKTAGTKTYVIDLSDGKGNTDVELPKNTEFTWEVVVHGDNKTLTAPKQLLITKDGVETGQIRKWRYPTSVAVNNDPNSTDFGSIYVAGNAYYQGTEAREYRGVQKVNPQFENMGWYGIYTGNTNYPLRVRISDDGRVFASSTTTSTATVWEVSNNLNNWTTRISESSQNHGMDVKGSGNNLKLLLYSYKNSKYICNEYTWNGSSFSAATPISVMHNSTAFGISGASTPHVNIRYDNYYDGYWFIGSRSSNTERQLAHIVKDGTSCDVAYTSSNHFGGAGALSYGEMLVKGHDNGHTTDNSSKLIFYRVSKNANGKVQLTVAYDEAKFVHSTCKGRYVNDFAIDHAYNLYIVSTQNTSVAAGNKSILAGTGQLMAFALPYSGHTTTRARDIADYTFSLVCDENIDYQVTLVANDNAMGSASITQGIKLNDGYQSCTDITVAATPNANYRFVNWTMGGEVVSTDNPYTFMVTDDITITANFAPAVFNVTWYNLFQEDQDITDYITNPNSAMDGAINSRLWRLFQVAFNEALKEKYPSGELRLDQANLTINGKQNVNVANFIAGTNAQNILLDFIGVTDNTTNQLSVRPFKWLGPYIKYALAQQDIPYIESYNTHTFWRGTLYRFFNRSSKAYTTGNTEWNYGTGDFTEYGKPTHWRSWWADIACELKPKMNYNTPMPKTWDKSYTPSTSIGDITLGDWYKWNPKAEDANKLLAWRYGDPTKVPSKQTLGPIVHNVYQDGALFATWVEKLVSEEKTIQNNSDAIWLLNYHNGTHDIKILRKMQGGMYNTLCLPFSATKAQQPSVLQNATIVQFTGVNENLYDESGEPVVELQFTKVDDIVAGVPYLVMPQTDITSEMTFTNIPTGYNGSTPLVMETAQEITKSTNNGSISFIGNIHPTNIPAQSLIVVANNRLAEVTEAGEIQHMRGYFRIDDAQLQTLSEEGKVYLSMRKPTTTSIPVAPEAEQQTKPEVRKIMRDGQIYILRGNEVYTITGNRIK